ncbi:MAG: 16S rRNA (adenine(1518)-N(6)/adenine(1519)-N(6))-dimethyltransferase RsmA [Candidatus Paceibacterota bacterium]
MSENFSQRAKKSLGQNFLKSEKALNQMITASELREGETVLEIGPGRGALTKKLLETGARVIAIEKDEVLAGELEIVLQDFCESGQLEIIRRDALEFNPSENKNFKKDYKIVANIPYYITGALIEKFLTLENPPQSITFLVQKEVAERIISKDKKESILSISIKVFGKPKYIATVPKGAFVPAPKVDSAIIHIADISNKIFKNAKNGPNEKRFFEVMKAGFAHKRKQLGGNLEGVVEKSKFEECGIDPKTRSEELKVEDWVCLARN